MKIRNLLSKLEARAGPNQRLVEAFGIDNSFTTTDDSRCKEFRTKAEEALVSRTRDWAAWSSMAEVIVRNELEAVEELGRTEIRLVTLVQTLTLKIALHVLFKSEPDLVQNAAYESIAEDINEIWMSSKKRRNLDWSDSTDLHQLLEDILPPPTSSLVPQRNPLNLILPAYETLWRVVLRCFVEVVYRDPTSREAAGWREVLKDFLHDPTREQLDDASKLGVSAAWIAKESLRLYPPTRRVYRHYKLGSQERVITAAADVETAQRDPAVWGSDAARFVPTRWRSINRARESRIFMAFGARPFSCPAKENFGPRMIALLVAALSEGVGEGWHLVAYHTEDDLIEGPMKTGRESYRTMYLRRNLEEAYG